MTRILVAYDGSPHAADALALGRQLASIAHGSLEFAHVHHTVPVQVGGELSHTERERLAAQHAEEILGEAARLAGETDARRHAVAATTTATGLRELAEREQIDVVVFGSAVGTTPGRVHPGSASRRLLQNGPAALAFAPAGYQSATDPQTVAAAEDDGEGSARRTAEALAERTSGRLASADEADLIVVGSRPGAVEGRVQVSPGGELTIQRATVPVLVVPRAKALALAGALATA